MTFPAFARRAAESFPDERQGAKVRHTQKSLLKQRVVALEQDGKTETITTRYAMIRSCKS